MRTFRALAIAAAVALISGSAFAHGPELEGLEGCHENPPEDLAGFHCSHPEPIDPLASQCASIRSYLDNPAHRAAALADLERLGCDDAGQEG